MVEFERLNSTIIGEAQNDNFVDSFDSDFAPAESHKPKTEKACVATESPICEIILRSVATLEKTQESSSATSTSDPDVTVIENPPVLTKSESEATLVNKVQSTKSYSSKPIVSNQTPSQESSPNVPTQKHPKTTENAEKQSSLPVKQMSPVKEVVNLDLLKQKSALKPTTINKSPKPAEKPHKPEKIDGSVRVLHEPTEQYEFSIRSVRKTPTPKPAEFKSPKKIPEPVKPAIKTETRSLDPKPKPKSVPSSQPKIPPVAKKQPPVKNSWGFLGNFFGTQSKKAPPVSKPSPISTQHKAPKPSSVKNNSAANSK